LLAVSSMQAGIIKVREYPGGVLAIDSGLVRDEMAACYLLEAGDQVAVIEAGGYHSAGRILEVLQKRGWERSAVSHVIVTHVHLDHAGGAGRLLQELPNARLVVHPYGARHMIDPFKLEAGTRVVFGDEAFDEMYVTLIPIAEERIIIKQEGDELLVGERRLRFIDTPGHARHHFCVWDEQTRGWFSGDTFGLSYRDLDTAKGPMVFPITTPIQFDPPALRASVQRLMQAEPECMYMTHFGRVTDTQRLAAQMTEGVYKLEEIALRHADAPDRTRKIQQEQKDWLYALCREHGVTLSDEALGTVVWDDIVLNTQGLEYWLDHRTP
ncbi:MAG TPA: MBL fold metallo-hydrolase, partial [Xanthomonadales bacterium]|nr:MBL fold metallo-hydrolase [Xanthomonadales bacterium]